MLRPYSNFFFFFNVLFKEGKRLKNASEGVSSVKFKVDILLSFGKIKATKY